MRRGTSGHRRGACDLPRPLYRHPLTLRLTPLGAQFIPSVAREKKGRRRKRMEGGRKEVVLSGGRKYGSGRLIPRRGQVKASIVIGLAQSLAALFSLAVARLA
ncbi:hypothetical protein GW17_00059951 [Ensete ventricosum]|nr:hypothetical protein GW17_00059951 [Ensete ventricosum]RZS21664.1 hypothetical protein BHM03_00054333 [Ensete ventricosum]